MSDSLSKLFQEIGDLLHSADTIAIASHARPDGDAIGSLVGLGDALKQAGKQVTMLNEDEVPHRYSFLDGTDEIVRPSTLKEPLNVDVFIALDTADKSRVGRNVWKALKSYKKLVILDHHISNERYGDLNYVNDASPSTGEIVYELIRQQNWPLSARSRDHIWTAMVTDTGSFQYAGTTDRTLEIAADLMREGVDVGPMSAMIYQNYPYRRLELLGRLLQTLKRSENGKIASWELTRATFKELGIRSEDTEGLIDHLRAIEGVVVAVSFEETGDKAVRISARSKDAKAANVSEICQRFGGGGHKLAAGVKISGTLEEVRKIFLGAVTEALEKV